MTVIVNAIAVFETFSPLKVIRLVPNRAMAKAIIKMIVNKMIVILPTLLYGLLSTNPFARDSTITPGKTDAIGT